ncbi:MAG: ABC transporter permease [Myxococcota bacterium]|nr:ABC transporter permease [Myxococcota bacterium]
MKFLVAVAWRNLWRQRRRSLVTAGAMALGMAMCMGVIAFQDGMYEEMRSVMVDQQLGHLQVHHPDYPSRRILFDTLPEGDALLGRLEADTQVEFAAGRLFGQALLGHGDKASGAQIIGVDPEREREVTGTWNTVEEGQYLGAEPTREIVLGSGLARSLEVDLGGEVVLVTQSADGSMGNDLYTVVGIATTGSATVDRAGAYVHLTDLQELLVLPDQLHEVTVLVEDQEQIETIATNLRETLGESHLVRPWWEVSPQSADMLAMNDVANGFIVMIVFGVAAIGVLNTMLMAVFERTHELGLLKALGFRPRSIVALIVVEGVLLSTVATAIGLTLGGALNYWLVVHGVSLMDEPLSFAGVVFDTRMHGKMNPEAVTYVVVAAYLVGVLAALWPAFRASRLQPVEAMRHD